MVKNFMLFLVKAKQNVDVNANFVKLGEGWLDGRVRYREMNARAADCAVDTLEVTTGSSYEQIEVTDNAFCEVG